jgi:hypothetical protein
MIIGRDARGVLVGAVAAWAAPGPRGRDVSAALARGEVRVGVRLRSVVLRRMLKLTHSGEEVNDFQALRPSGR